MTITTLQLGLPGGPELLIVLVVIVLLFGANRIPKLARSTGEAMGEFRRGREQIEDEITEAATGETRDSEETETELDSEFDEDFDETEATKETDKSA